MTNDKKTTTLIIIACVIAVAFIAFLLWKSYQVRTSPYREVILSDYPLQKGSKGDSVIALQRQLNIELSKIDLGDGLYEGCNLSRQFRSNHQWAFKYYSESG